MWGHKLTTLDTDSAEKIYRELYKTLGKAIGFQMARNIIKMGEDGFDQEAPVESLTALNDSLVTAFGKATAQVNSADLVYWEIEMNDLGANILAVMENSNLGKMSVHVLNKQSKDMGIDLNKLTEKDVSDLIDQLTVILPFFLGDEAGDVLAKIRRYSENRMAVV
jgi:hypothetical protein